MTKRFLVVCLLAFAFAFAARPAHAGEDAVQFGSDIHVSHDGSVHDAVCFFCSVDDEGTVNGDIVVFFGNVHIAGGANHDVVTFFGNVTADNDTQIGNDLVNFFGAVRLGQHVSVGQDLVSMFGSLHAADSVTVGQDRVVEPAWIFFGPLLFMAIIVIVIVREVRSQRRRQFLRNYPFPPHP